jgi:hexulose-6-phosphate isomerase
MKARASRREWLGASAALAGGLACRSAAPGAPTPRSGSAVRKGLGLGMIGAGDTLLEKFKIAAACGFEGVELDAPNELSLDEVLTARAATGLAIPSVVDSVHWQHSLGDPDPEVRKRGRAGLEAALAAARDYGAQRVLLVPAVVDAARPYDLAWSHSLVEIRAAARQAAALGVQIAIENVWNQFIPSPLEARRYLDEIDSEWVGWYLDLGNLVIHGWPEQWVRILGPRILQLHVKEFSRRRMDEEGRWKGFAVELGEGDNDWPATVRALEEIGYRGWGIAEVDGGGEERLRDVRARMERCFTAPAQGR